MTFCTSQTFLVSLISWRFLTVCLSSLSDWQLLNEKPNKSRNNISGEKINANKAQKKVNKTFAMQTGGSFQHSMSLKQLFHFRFCSQLGRTSTNFTHSTQKNLKLSMQKRAISGFAYLLWWQSFWCSLHCRVWTPLGDICFTNFLLSKRATRHYL